MIKETLENNQKAQVNSREVELLKKDFPQYFDKDGNFKFNQFKKMLGQEEVELDKEGYELNFLGKSYAKYESSLETETVITPDTKHNQEDINKNSENLYIVGDNIDALKHLLNSYSNKIKCIYIDPPYNTGSDGFVYPDNFKFDKETLSNKIGVDEQEAERILELEGKSTHSAWLTFLYSRLLLARDLLQDEGAIFISIDENEKSNLKLLADEIFGEENCVGIISNSNNPKGRSDEKYIASSHEYIVVYAKSINSLDWYGFEPTEKITKRYNKTDVNSQKYREIDLRKTGENDLREDRPNLFYYFYYNEKTGDFYPDYDDYESEGYIQIKPQREDKKDGRWRWELKKARNSLNKLEPKFMPNRKIWGVMEKDFLEGRSLVKPTSLWATKDVNSERGTEEFVSLGFDKRVFPKPKPVGTIKRCIQLVSQDDNEIILDFFSGSSTTAHSIMKLNSEDRIKRKYIMIQWPESISDKKYAYAEGYRTIDEIGRERIKRAAQKIKEETNANIDYGFKLYRLNTPTESTIDKLIEFNPEDYRLLSTDFITPFEFNGESGKDTILTTWLNEDGYGLLAEAEPYKLANYQADLFENSLYIIHEGLRSEDIMELIKRIETNQLIISRIVVYAHSLSFDNIHELKNNVANLKNNRTVTVIERY